jgi:pilus assembly protein TadC
MKFNPFKKKSGEAQSQAKAEPDAEIKKEKEVKSTLPEEKEKLAKAKPREKIQLNKQFENRLKRLTDLKNKKIFSKKKRKLMFRGFAKNIKLQAYLEKAGMEGLDAKIVTKKISRITIFIGMLFSFFLILMAIILQGKLVNLIVLLIGFWLTIFFFLLALIWAGYLFYLDMKIFRRTLSVEEVFPDFLQLTSANISAGMPIDQALWYAVRPGFGVLAKEIETVAKNTMAGEDLSVALTNFANKYNSKIIQRSISLLIEGMAAGGEMADLLNKIALNIDETKILKKEMAANVTTYVIFITFATIAAAPVLFGLATQLLVVIKEITSKLGPEIGSSAMFSFSFSSGSIKTSDFRLFSYIMLTISAISSACIVSVIRKGRVKEGLSRIPVFIGVSVVLYTLACLIISSMFKGII